MSDPFYSDDDTSKKSSSGPLMPIVEVPSEAGSSGRQSTARSDLSSARSERSDADTELTQGSDERSDQDSDHHEDESPGSSRPPSGRRRKPKTKNGKIAVDLTPPDKLLKKAEKKSKRYIKEKKVDKAIRELIRCTALARIVYGDGHWKLAKAHVDLATGYLDLKGYAAQAEYHCDLAKSTMMAGGAQISSSSTEKANILTMTMSLHYTLGRALSLLKKLREAEQALNKSEKIAAERAKISSVSDDDIDDWDIKIYNSIARLSAKQQKFAMATSYFEKALEILEDVYGKDSTRLIPVLQGMGAVEQSKGKLADHEKAIEYYLQAHSIAAAKYKSGRVELADTANALGDAYAKVGNEDADTSAESYYNECLATYQSVYGPIHEKTLDVQDDMARLMVRTDRGEEAISLLRSTFDSKKEVCGEFSSEVADTWKLIGSVYLSQGDTEKALRALKKCHSTECTLYGTNHKKSKETQRTMDILLANPMLASKQKKSKAEELKERPRFSSIVSRSAPVGASPVAS